MNDGPRIFFGEWHCSIGWQVMEAFFKLSKSAILKKLKKNRCPFFDFLFLFDLERVNNTCGEGKTILGRHNLGYKNTYWNLVAFKTDWELGEFPFYKKRCWILIRQFHIFLRFLMLFVWYFSNFLWCPFLKFFKYGFERLKDLFISNESWYFS